MDFNYNANASYNFSGGTFVAYIDKDGVIWRENTQGRSIAGYDTKYVSELQERLDEYYNKLVDLKVIVPPKTPEQIIQEQNQQQAEINKQLLETISSLKDEVKELKNNGINRNATTEDSSSVREEPTRNNISDKSSKKNDAGNK